MAPMAQISAVGYIAFIVVFYDWCVHWQDARNRRRDNR